MTMDEATVATTARELIALLEEQKSVYQAIEQLAEKQSTLVASNDLTPLLKLLAGREKLTRQLQHQAQRLMAVRQSWEQAKSQVPTAERERIEQLTDQVQASAKRLMLRDEQDTAMLSARKQGVGQEMGRLRCGEQVARAYGGSTVSTVGGLDQTERES